MAVPSKTEWDASATGITGRRPGRPRSRGRGRARCQQPRVRSSSAWTAPPSPPRRWSSTRPPAQVAGARPGAAHRHAPGRAARATRGSGGTRCARRCASAVTRPAQPPPSSIGGQQHGLVTLDAHGRAGPPRAAVERRALGAAGAPAGRGARRPEAWAERTGSRARRRPSPSPSGPGCAEHEPEAAARRRGRAAPPRLPHRAADGPAAPPTAATPRAPAGGRPAPRRTTTELLAAVGLDPALLPRVLAAGRGRPGPSATARPAAAPGHPGRRRHRRQRGRRAGPRAAPRAAPVLSLGTSGTVYAVSPHRPADPTGTVAGLRRRADGDWLPLACTLNCTLAVDKVAALLGLDREAVEPGGAVTLLPYLDGERTPNLPHASGLLHGLRHDTTGRPAAPGRVRRRRARAARRARPGPRRGRGPLDEPLLLIGGGARGTAWQQTVRRLSGRPVQVPEAKELVALGAAAQAAGAADRRGPGRGRPPLGHRGGRSWTRWSGTRRRWTGSPRYSPTRRRCWSRAGRRLTAEGRHAPAEPTEQPTRTRATRTPTYVGTDVGARTPDEDRRRHDRTAARGPTARRRRRLPNTQQGMRRRNLARVMHAVAAEGPLSRAGGRRAHRTDQGGRVDAGGRADPRRAARRAGPRAARPGRAAPAPHSPLSGRGPAGIGAEVGVDHLAACAVDLRGEVRARAVRHGTQPRPRPRAGARGTDRAGPAGDRRGGARGPVAGRPRGRRARPGGARRAHGRARPQPRLARHGPRRRCCPPSSR